MKIKKKKRSSNSDKKFETPFSKLCSLIMKINRKCWQAQGVWG